MHIAVFIVIVILGTIFIYGVELFFLFAFYRIFDKNLTKFMLIPPAILVVPIVLLMVIGHFTNDILFMIFYNLGTGILAYEIDMVIFVIIYLIINKFHKLNKWWGLAIVLIIPTALTLYGFINPWIIHIDRRTLEFDKFSNTVTIAHLSDIHLGGQITKSFIKKIVKKLKKENPDIVVITGDFADGSLKVKSKWIEPFNDLKMPILYVTGNHESYHGKEDMLIEVNKTKIKYIGDRVWDEKGIRFVGIDYEYKLKERLDEFLKEGQIDYDPYRPNILLCHIPELRPKELKKWNIFLFLAGHTHAGQLFPCHFVAKIAYPMFSGLYKYKNKESEGEDDEEEGTEGGKYYYDYVSQGVGFATIPMRTFTQSTIAMITIKGKN